MAEAIIIINDSSVLSNKVINLIKKEENTIIVLDYYSQKLLNDMNVKHITYETFLSESEIKVIEKNAFEITTNWYKNEKIQQNLTINEINLGWLLEQELHYYLIETIAYFTSFRNIENKLKPDKVFVTSGMRAMAEIVFQDSKIESIEEKKERQQTAFEYFAVKYNIGRTPITFRIPRRLFFKIRKNYERIFIPLFNKLYSNINKHKNSVLLVDFNVTLYEQFLNCLRRNERTILLLNRRRAAIWNLKSFNILRNIGGILLSYEGLLNQEDKNKIKNQILEINGKIDVIFSDEKLFADLFSVNNTSFWYYISKYFKKYCIDRFEEAIYEMAGAKKLLLNYKPSVILHFFESALQEKILIHQARKLQIPSILLQHGTPPIALPRFPENNPIHATIPLYEDKKMACWGNMIKQYAMENGMKEENVIVSGSPRHDPYFTMKKNFLDNKKGIILIALGALDRGNFLTQSITTYDRYEKSLKIICNAIRKIKDREKIIKCHPADMVWKTVVIDPIIHSIDPSIQIFVDANLVKLLQSAEVVITIGLTTILMEANIFEKPTISLIADHLDFLGIHRSGQTELFTSDQAEKFGIYLNSVLTNNKAREDNVQRGREFVKSYLANHGCSSEYLAKKISEY